MTQYNARQLGEVVEKEVCVLIALINYTMYRRHFLQIAKRYNNENYQSYSLESCAILWLEVLSNNGTGPSVFVSQSLLIGSQR